MAQAATKPVRKEPIKKALKQIYYSVGKYFGNQTYKNVKSGKKSIKFEPNVGQFLNPRFINEVRPYQQGFAPVEDILKDDYWFAWVEKLIKGSLGQRITWISNYTKETFISVVDRIAYAGFEEGLSIDKIAKSIMKDLNITEKYRAERIARTEVIGASNMSSHAGAQATGLDLEKEWIAFIDDKTRESHIEMNGQKIDMNATFSNGLEVPGDPSGSAEEVINCRCTVGYSGKDEEPTFGRL